MELWEGGGEVSSAWQAVGGQIRLSEPGGSLWEEGGVGQWDGVDRGGVRGKMSFWGSAVGVYTEFTVLLGLWHRQGGMDFWTIL